MQPFGPTNFLTRSPTAPAAVAAFLFALLGSRIVTLLDTALLRPLVLGLLIVVTMYVFLGRRWG